MTREDTVNMASDDTIPTLSVNKPNLQDSGEQLENSTDSRLGEDDVEQDGTTTVQTTTGTKHKILQTALLLLALFTTLSGYSLISPFFPQQAKKIGLTDTEVGIIFAFFPAVVFIVAPIYGTLVSIALHRYPTRVYMC